MKSFGVLCFLLLAIPCRAQKMTPELLEKLAKSRRDFDTQYRPDALETFRLRDGKHTGPNIFDITHEYLSFETAKRMIKEPQASYTLDTAKSEIEIFCFGVQGTYNVNLTLDSFLKQGIDLIKFAQLIQQYDDHGQLEEFTEHIADKFRSSLGPVPGQSPPNQAIYNLAAGTISAFCWRVQNEHKVNLTWESIAKQGTKSQVIDLAETISRTTARGDLDKFIKYIADKSRISCGLVLAK